MPFSCLCQRENCAVNAKTLCFTFRANLSIQLCPSPLLNFIWLLLNIRHKNRNSFQVPFFLQNEMSSTLLKNCTQLWFRFIFRSLISDFTTFKTARFFQKVSDLMPTDSKFIFQDCFVGRKNGWFYLVAWSSQLNQYTMAFGVKWFSKPQ